MGTGSGSGQVIFSDGRVFEGLVDRGRLSLGRMQLPTGHAWTWTDHQEVSITTTRTTMMMMMMMMRMRMRMRMLCPLRVARS